MYYNESFNNYLELTNFLNSNKIKKENIIKIENYKGWVELIYYK